MMVKILQAKFYEKRSYFIILLSLIGERGPLGQTGPAGFQVIFQKTNQDVFGYL